MDTIFNRLKNEYPTFEEIKSLTPSPKLRVKEEGALGLICSNLTETVAVNDDSNAVDQFANRYRTVIVDTETCTPLFIQPNFTFNDDSCNVLPDVFDENVTVGLSYEGTMVTLLHHDDKWHITTRRCLDAYKSIWIHNLSFGEIFDQAIDGLFTLDELNPEYVYQFIILDHRNKRLISYDHLFGHNYSTVVHSSTFRKGQFVPLDGIVINDKVHTAEKLKFDTLDDMLNELRKLEKRDRDSCTIKTEGFIIRLRSSSGEYAIHSVQTKLYEVINKYCSHNNVNKTYLHMYQKGMLASCGKYITNHPKDILSRVDNSFKTMSKEISNIYHNTRRHANKELYNSLPGSYKSILFDLHGIFINNKKHELNEDDSDPKMAVPTGSIKFYDVYQFLKKIPFSHLERLYYDRSKVLENASSFMHPECLPTQIQIKLMGY